MEAIYLGDFTKLEDLEEQFATTFDPEIHILVACYETENWEGSAMVIFEQEGSLFLVEGSHCSCYGLEGQWNPTEITVDYVNYRAKEGSFFGSYEDLNNKFLAALKTQKLLEHE